MLQNSIIRRRLISSTCCLGFLWRQAPCQMQGGILWFWAQAWYLLRQSVNQESAPKGIFCNRMWIRNLAWQVSSATEYNSRIWMESLLPQNCTICLQSLGSANRLKMYVCREKQVCTLDDIKVKGFHISLTSLPHCEFWILSIWLPIPYFSPPHWSRMIAATIRQQKLNSHKVPTSLPLYEVRKAQELTVLDLVPDRNHLLLLLWSSVHEEKGIIFIIIRSWSETCWIIWLQCPCIRIVLVKLHFDIIPFESLALKILLMFLFSFSFFIFLLQHGSYKYFANSQNLSADEPH